jgi:hypothetical protein
MNLELHCGDIVTVKTAAEIMHGLDINGTLDGLPFMPEMVDFCGKNYRVSTRVVQVTIDALATPLYRESYVREFKNNDVVMLEDLRCSGTEHGGCQRGCKIFWKQAWLKKIEDARAQPNLIAEGKTQLLTLLKTESGSGSYFCQSSEFQMATDQLSFMQRLKKCLCAINFGNCSPSEMMKRIAVWSWWKARKKLMGVYPHGNCKPTPVAVLNLQPGELVEVKLKEEIFNTLDKNGMNRGLHFSADMIPFCGKKNFP